MGKATGRRALLGNGHRRHLRPLSQELQRTTFAYNLHRRNCSGLDVELGEPVVLTVKAVASPRQQQFFKHVGMMKMPVTWADYQQDEYVVYAKGKLEMGGFVNLIFAVTIPVRDRNLLQELVRKFGWVCVF